MWTYEGRLNVIRCGRIFVVGVVRSIFGRLILGLSHALIRCRRTQLISMLYEIRDGLFFKWLGFGLQRFRSGGIHLLVVLFSVSFASVECLGVLLVCPFHRLYQVRALLWLSISRANACRPNRIHPTLRDLSSIAYRYAGMDPLTTGRPCFGFQWVALRRLCLVGRRRFQFRLRFLTFANRVMDTYAVCLADQRDKECLLCLTGGHFRHLFRRLANGVLHEMYDVCFVFRVMEQDDDTRLCNDRVLFHVVLGLLCSLNDLTYASGRRPYYRKVRYAYVSGLWFLRFRPPTRVMANIPRSFGEHPSRQFVGVGCFSFFGVRPRFVTVIGQR